MKLRFSIRAHKWRWLAGTLVVLVALWLAASFVVTWKLTHRRRAMAAEAPPPSNLPVDSLRINTADGESLGAWLIRGKADKPAVLLLHGLGGSRRNFLPLMYRLHKDECTVLAITLRAHGDSTGETIDFGYSSRADVVAAVKTLRQTTSPTTPIIVCGTSLGSGAAMFAAKELGTDVAGYLLESPYRDLATAVDDRLNMRLPRVARPIAYGGLWLWAHVLLPVNPSKISPHDAAADVPLTVPVVILTGTKDHSATVKEAAAIHARVQSHGTLIKFNGGGHATLFRTDPEKYYAAVQLLMKKD